MAKLFVCKCFIFIEKAPHIKAFIYPDDVSVQAHGSTPLWALPFDALGFKKKIDRENAMDCAQADVSLCFMISLWKMANARTREVIRELDLEKNPKGSESRS